MHWFSKLPHAAKPRSKSRKREKAPVMTNVYILLIFAIAAETVATSALQASQQFTKAGPTLLAVVGYAVALYLLAFCIVSLLVVSLIRDRQGIDLDTDMSADD